MNYWEALVHEVTHKKDQSQEFRFTDVGRKLLKRTRSHARREQRPRTTEKPVIFELEGQFKGIYLTKREGECLYYFLQGQTIPQAAEQMKLSARTVEFYLKNMKLKLGIATKFEVVEVMLETGIYEQLEKVFADSRSVNNGDSPDSGPFSTT